MSVQDSLSASISALSAALAARASLFEARHESAFRLFNGFLEGSPDLVVDLFARTLVLHNYADQPTRAVPLLAAAQEFYLRELPWIQAVIVKTRYALDQQGKTGALVYGQRVDRKIRENGIWYAIDLTLNQDTSLYLDTRNLRAWAAQSLSGRKVLNTFAYTGSLGVAALAGGATRVVQTDLHRKFLNLAKDSYALNGFPLQKSDFLTGDFWTVVSRLKRSGELFDCVFLDPPFFSTTARGRVDLVHESQRVINKVRPLINDAGWLVAVNNALFLTGAEYIALLDQLTADGYLSLEQLIPIPNDITGFPQTRVRAFPVDPAPFNHPTKVAILRVKRKQPLPTPGNL